MRSLPPRLIISVAAAATAALITVGVGIYGLLSGPRQGASPVDGTTSVGSASAAPSATEQRQAVNFHPTTTLPHTNDPDVYVRAVSAALFNWDTASGYLPTDITAAVISDGDPSGEEMPGLTSDVATYEPTTDAWLNLATMDVTQRLQITSLSVPNDWTTIAATAHGQLRPGTRAITVAGIRHRWGVWLNQSATSVTPVSFTVFVACRPTFDRCHVLRLSQVNNPLP